MPKQAKSAEAEADEGLDAKKLRWARTRAVKYPGLLSKRDVELLESISDDLTEAEAEAVTHFRVTNPK